MKPIKLEILLEGKGVKKGFEDVGGASKKMEQDFRKALSAQYDLIKKLEKELANLEKQLNKTSPGAAKAKLGEQVQAAKKVIQEEKKALDELEGSVNKNASSSQTLRTQIRNLENDMATMTEGTKEYYVALQKLGDLKDRQGDIATQGRIFSDDNKNIRATADAIAGLSGAMSAGVGIASLFGKEGEDLAKIQRNLQAVMATTIGIQQVANTLNKDSYFSHIVLGGAKRKMAAAQAFLNTQLGIGVGLSKALMVSGIGLLIAGIGTAVIAYQRWNARQKEANKLKKEYIELESQSIKGLANELTKIQDIERVANNANKPMAERIKAINTLNTLMPGYNGHLDKETGGLVRNQEAMTNYVKALANMEVLKQLAIKDAEDTLRMIEIDRQKEKFDSGEIEAEIKWYEKAVQAFAKSIEGQYGGSVFTDESFAEAKKNKAQKKLDEEKALLKKGLKERADIRKKYNEGTPPLTLSDLERNKSQIASQLGEQYLSAIRKIEQQEIALMEDGYKKRKQQAELDYQLLLDNIEKEKEARLKHLEELKKSGQKVDPKANDTINSQASEQAENAKKIRDKNIDTINREEDKKESEKLEKLRAMYQDYEEQRLAIATKYVKEREKIKRSELTDKEKQSKLAVIDKEEKKELKSIDDLVLKQSGAWASLFADASSMSKKQIDSTIQSVKKLLDYLNGTDISIPIGFTEQQLESIKEDPAKIKAIYDALIEKQNELDSRTNYVFSGIVKGFGKIRQASELYKKSLSTIKKEEREALQNQAEAEKARGISYLRAGVVEASDAVSFLSDRMRELAEVSDNGKFKDTAEKLGAVAQNLSAAAKGAQQGGWIGAIIGGATDLISQAVSSIAGKEASIKEFEESRLAFIQDYELSLLKIKSEDFDTVFGTKSIAKSSAALEKAGEAMRLYREEMNKRTKPKEEKESSNLGATVMGLGIGGGFEFLGLKKRITSESKAAMEAYKKGYSDLEAMAIKTRKRSGFAKFFGKKDEFTSLKDLAPQLFKEGELNLDAAKAFLSTNTQITDEQKKQLEYAVQLRESYEENLKLIDSEIEKTFGKLSDSITNDIFNSIRKGSDAWELFGKAGSEVIDALGKQLIKEMYVQTYLDSYKKRMQDAYKLGGVEKTQQELASIMADIYSGLGTVLEGAGKAAKDWDERAKKSGFDLSKSSEADTRQAAAKGVQSVSQDSANKIEGQLAYIQMQSEKKTVAINNMSAALHNALAPLSRIAANTEYCKHLEKMQKDMESMSNNISSMQSQGINLKR